MDLNEIAIFIKVAQLGSFTQAARQLQMPNSTVSAKVSSLERRLGVTLIQRTTRKLNLTPAGRTFFERCLEGMGQLSSAEAELAALKGEPQGLLRLTAPVELGSLVLPMIVSTFTKRYPKTRVETILTDRRVDLLAESVDLAVRAGHLRDSTLVAKKLGNVHFSLFAAPKYLKHAPPLTQPRDLSRHEIVHFTPLGFEEWRLTRERATVHVPVPSRLIANDMNMVKAMIVGGAGIGLIPSYYCAPELRAGKVVVVLPGWRTESAPIHFVYPAQKFVSPKLSAFIALATEPLKASLTPEGMAQNA